MTKKRTIIISVIAALAILLSSLVIFTVKTINGGTSTKTTTSSSTTETEKTDENISYDSKGAVTLTESTEISKAEYTSETADQNSLLINGDVDVTLDTVKVTKTGNSDGGDNTSFYGTNSGILAKGGANVTIKNAVITTDATGANGVFSYGGSATTNNSSSDGTTVTISDSKITTTKDNSGGIMTTGGGTMIANNLTVNTAGTSSAAIRSDRGGGTVTVTGGTYNTTGKGSPVVYSTADITVNDATMTATASEGIVIEGKNSVTLNNCNLTDTNNTLNGQSTTYKNIFIYQSMSGDAAQGGASFSATDCTITTNKGDVLYVTNTSADIYLKGNTFITNDSTGNFLRIKADSWGKSGSNGGTVTLTADGQVIKGNIVVDNISTLTMTLKNSSSYTGTINGDNTAKQIALTLDASSKIKLTGDCYVTSFTDADSTYSNIDFNGYKLYVNGVAIN